MEETNNNTIESVSILKELENPTSKEETIIEEGIAIEEEIAIEVIDTPINTLPEALEAPTSVETPEEVVIVPKKKGGAPKGPRKHTETFVKAELADILDLILKDPEIILLGQVFEKRPYPRQCYSEWANDFKDIKVISDTIRRIDDILEYRVNFGGLKSKLDGRMVVFNLKNNYGWKEKTETDVSIKEMPKPILGGITDEEPK